MGVSAQIDSLQLNTSPERHLATWLSAFLPPPINRDGVALYRMPIAVTGSWVKGDHHFSITENDAQDMVRNFNKRKNGMIPIDFEHASEQPDVARGGPVPAAGWIHRLSLEHAKDAQKNKLEVMADVEWPQETVDMIRSAKYRFFSPAIDWAFRDKTTGKEQGATLTSGALTNHPFLEELPAIHLAERARSQGAVLCSDLAEITEPKGERMSQKLKAEELTEKLKDAPKVTAQKIEKGQPHAGMIAVFGDGGVPLGYMTKAHLAELAEKNLPETDDDPAEDMKCADGELAEETLRRKMRATSKEEAEDLEELKARAKATDEMKEKNEELTAKLDELRAERSGDARAAEEMRVKAAEKAAAKTMSEIGCTGVQFGEIKRLLEVGRKVTAGEGKRILLREACPDGVLDKNKASFLAAEGKAKTQDYIDVDSASTAIDKAVQQGKILPRQRKFYLMTAIDRPDEFKEWLADAIPQVRMGTDGIGQGEGMSVDDEIRVKTNQLMAENKWDYKKAYTHVLATDSVLAERYKDLHRQINN